MSGLEAGHPGNRVYCAHAYGPDSPEWVILVAARDNREARRLALPVLESLCDPDQDVILDMRVRLFHRPNGGIGPPDVRGAAETPEEFKALGFECDEDATWFEDDPRPVSY